MLQMAGTTENASPVTKKFPKNLQTHTVQTMNLNQHQITVIDDETAVATITCFSPEAHTFVPDCNELLNSIDNKDKHQLPSTLKELETRKFIFQYHFGKREKIGYPDFNLDTVFKPSPQPLLQLQAPATTASPPQEILEQSSIAMTPAKDSSQGSMSTSTTTKKTTRRELFPNSETTEKKPRKEI
nr:hypothetical protein [Tanacetum cinerariifolium]